MNKKQKKKKASSTRTRRCYLSIKKNSVHFYHLRTLTRNSKSLYNSALFIRKQFYRIAQQYRKHVLAAKTYKTMNDLLTMLRLSWKNQDMLNKLCLSMSKCDLEYAMMTLGRHNSVSSYIEKYLESNLVFVDTCLPRESRSMTFQDMLDVLTTNDNNLLIDTSCEMQAVRCKLFFCNS